ncbi:cytochrome P450 1A1-like [Lingula anatina]|uniref:Cytochrome P450 1A1-like n=1 Tax=Lingula anatina TaxID=7574 RepID=A0A1S3IHS9_LINAN|nr:cytochrome P450 1A1-like [Lingula anatina]|eukprot:XP_013397772.1 cytochrome P450 1A1-like [Lingula anatina]
MPLTLNNGSYSGSSRPGVFAVSLMSYLLSGKLNCLAKSAFEEVAPLLAKQTEPVDVDLYTTLLIYNIICTVAFGKSYKFDDPEFLWLKEKLAEIMTVLFGSRLPADILPFLKHVPIPSTRRAKEIRNEMIDFQRRMLKEHEASLNPENVRDLTDQLLLARQDHGTTNDGDVKKVLTDDCIIQIVLDTFIGGVIASRETFKWLLLYVADKPDVQEKMHLEIMDVFGEITTLSRSKMKYCEAVFKETLRIRPATPCTLAHKALRDTTLGNRIRTKVVFSN